MGISSIQLAAKSDTSDSNNFYRCIEPIENLPLKPIKLLEMPVRPLPELKLIKIAHYEPPKPKIYHKPVAIKPKVPVVIDQPIKKNFEDSKGTFCITQKPFIDTACFKTYELPETTVVAKRKFGPYDAAIPNLAYNHFSAGVCIPFMNYSMSMPGTSKQMAIPIRFTGMIDWSIVRGRTDIKGLLKDLNPTTFEGWKTVDSIKQKIGMFWYLPDIRFQISVPLHWIKAAYNFSRPTRLVVQYFGGSGEAFDKLMRAEEAVHQKISKTGDKIAHYSDDYLYFSITIRPSNIAAKAEVGSTDTKSVFYKSMAIEIPIRYYQHHANMGMLGDNMPMQKGSSPLLSNTTLQDRSYYHKTRARNFAHDNSENGGRYSDSIIVSISDNLEKPIKDIGLDNITISWLHYSPYAYKVASPGFVGKKFSWNTQNNIARPWTFVRFRGIDSAMNEISSMYF